MSNMFSKMTQELTVALGKDFDNIVRSLNETNQILTTIAVLLAIFLGMWTLHSLVKVFWWFKKRG